MHVLEIAANAITTLSIWLAARNSLYTWPVGIVGCALFGLVFLDARLYAEVTLQIFFVATSALGWWQWLHSRAAGDSSQRPVTRAAVRTLCSMGVLAAIFAVLYGLVLHRFTNAYLPYVDSAVLALSVMAPLLLMQRKIETWPVWLMVNTLSVGLFMSRHLWVTAALYALYWFNAWYGWWRWKKECAPI